MKPKSLSVALLLSSTALGCAGAADDHPSEPPPSSPEDTASVAAQALTLPTNLVTDGSFEAQTSSAVASPWAGAGAVIESTATPPHGKKNALIQGSTGWNAIQEWVAVKPFSHYSASVAVSSSDNLTGAYFSARGNVTFNVINEVAFGATGSGWKTLRFEFDTGSDTSVLLYAGFWGNGGNATLRVDDFTVMNEASVLANGSFEAGLSPWFGGAVETSGQHSGTGAALVRGSTGWLATNQWLTVAKNTQYHVTAWIRTSANVGAGYLSIRGNATESTFDVINQVAFGAMTGTYQLVSFDFNSGPNSSVLLYAGYWAPGADSQIEVDDVAVTPAGDLNAYYECDHMTGFSAGQWTDNTVTIGDPLAFHILFQRQPGLPEGQGTMLLDGVATAIEYPKDPSHPDGWGFVQTFGPKVTSNTARSHTATLVTACGTETRTIAILPLSPTAPHSSPAVSPVTINRGKNATLQWQTYITSQEAHSVCAYFTSKLVVSRASDGAVTGTYVAGAFGGNMVVSPTETTDYTIVTTCTNSPDVYRRTTVRLNVTQPKPQPPPVGSGGACGTNLTGIHTFTVLNETASDTLSIWRFDELTGAENYVQDISPGQSSAVTIPNCRSTDVVAMSLARITENNEQWGTTYDPHDAASAQHWDFASSVTQGILGSDTGITTPVVIVSQ